MDSHGLNQSNQSEVVHEFECCALNLFDINSVEFLFGKVGLEAEPLAPLP